MKGLALIGGLVVVALIVAGVVAIGFYIFDPKTKRNINNSFKELTK